VVAVFAVVRDLAILLGVICSLDRAGVDLKGLPAVFILAKAFPEPPVGPRRIPKCQPEDFGVFVG
jgi:hypothetical protein